MAFNPQYSQTDAQSHLDRWSSSGKSMAEYCRDNNIRPSTFYGWRKRLKKHSQKSLNHFVLRITLYFATCLLNGVNPQEYLPDVLMRMAIRPEDADVKDLLPAVWANPKNKNNNTRIEYSEN